MSMQRFPWPLAVMLVICFSGCSLIPSYQRPALPVPNQFSNAAANPASKDRASDIGWQDFFKDPRLQQLITLALKNNRDYHIALLNVEQVRAQYRIVRYGLLPTVGFQVSGLQQREILSSGKYSTISHYQAQVNTSYEVDLFGSIRSLKAQVLEQYLATQEASRASQITLVAELAVQYLTERALEEQLALLDQTLKSVVSYYDLIRQSYQLGNATALDLSQARTQVQSIKVSMANYERQRAQAGDALALLIGQPLPTDLPPAPSLAEQNLMEDLPVGVSSDLIEQRPDILQAEHQLKASNANIGVVRAAFFPSITLTASDGTSSVKLNKLFGPTSGGIWSFAPQVNLPLFNQNTNLANLEAAKVAKNIQIAQYEKTVQTAFSEVSDAIAARDSFNTEIQAQRALVKSEQERYDLSGLRYRSGIDNYLTVLLAQQDLYSAQANLIQVSLDRFTNLISLYKALGGGWKEK